MKNIEIKTERHKSKTTIQSRLVTNTAGAREWAGFIEASYMNAMKNMSRPTIPPITIPLNPFRPLVYTTTKITAIKSPDVSISIPNTEGRGNA